MFKRKPDVIIGGFDNPYLLRWHLIPRNRFFNIYLHKFLRSDDDRALHDHPWASCSIILKGCYWEYSPNNILKKRRRGNIIFRKASQAHRIELLRVGRYEPIGADINPPITWVTEEVPAWTLFITGPKVREWGFHCQQGWLHWRVYLNIPIGEPRGDEVGHGCEQ